MDFFPLRKIIFFELGLFFIQWQLKINIPTSPLLLWEHIVQGQGQIYKQFVKSNGNNVLIILETFFEVRSVNHLKQFIVENEGFIFLHDEIFLDLQIENKINSWSLQVSCNSAHWKKETLKNIKAQTGFELVPPRY